MKTIQYNFTTDKYDVLEPDETGTLTVVGHLVEETTLEQRLENIKQEAIKAISEIKGDKI